ncbi:MAG: hypothetical protein ABIG95_07120 [Candidatus Woesearchaeota archaeon]
MVALDELQVRAGIGVHLGLQGVGVAYWVRNAESPHWQVSTQLITTL